MVFVTVGTHEQQFNRLVKAVDELREAGSLDEEVVIQTGYSTYEPRFCEWSKLYPYQEMAKLMAEARIVVTHGGPSSFIMALQIGKVPIVVPRQKRFGEHVNDHQVEFCRAVKERVGNIILVEETQRLRECIENYEFIVMSHDVGQVSNNAQFIAGLESAVAELIPKEKKDDASRHNVDAEDY